MQILDCEQGSAEWFRGRLGIPTASGFDKIISSTGKASTQANGYMHKLLAEWLTGKSEDGYTNDSMERGKELEAAAREFYAFTHDVEVQQVGLVYRDENKLVACSPDGLTEPAGLEIKCPLAHTHVSYLLANKVPSKYIPQIQGSMWVTGRQYWDFMSHHPDMHPLIIRVARDEKYINTLADLVGRFIKTMLEKRSILEEQKHGK